MNDAARASLLARVRAKESITSGLPATSSAFTDFTMLPGFDELRMQLSFAKLAGIESPFFRVHEGRAGAETSIDGRRYLNFSSYDYLGLNAHPEVAEAAKAAIDRYGVSSSASRVVAGERPVHRDLERALAAHYQAEDCVVMVGGHATNVGVIGHLLGPADLFVYDEMIHNSAVMGGLLSKADRRSFPHNDMNALESMLASLRRRYQRTLIVVEGLYSMDGDVPDLPRLIQLKKKYDAWLMVDEAHALGVLGERGNGVAEYHRADPRDVDIWMGTLSKTLAATGGFIAGAGALIEFLKYTAGAFVFSVGIPPPVAAAAERALRILHREPERVRRLQANGALFHEEARRLGLDTGTGIGSAITPIIIGDSVTAILLSQALFERGINVLPIIPPAVPARASRLRFFLTSEHTEEQIKRALSAIVQALPGIEPTKRLLAKVLQSKPG